jgi:hypothetical protein
MIPHQPSQSVVEFPELFFARLQENSFFVNSQTVAKVGGG